MKRPFSSLLLGATLLSAPVALALSPADIPQDLPISQLLKSASTSLATGKASDALLYFDAAITRDPQNYLSFFKRGAAYLSLGKSVQAERDFSKVLELKPGFEGALLQRAKIRARNGEWHTARKDYVDAGKRSEGQELEELKQAEGAAIGAQEASNKSNWDECIAQSGIAILVAGGQPDLRRLRANCRFEKGEIAEALSDLQHVIALGSSSTEPHMQISAMSYYSLGETDQGLAQVRKCLQSDPDSKDCRKLMKREKTLDKGLKKLSQAVEKRQFATAAKLLIGKGNEDDPGLMNEAKNDFTQLQEDKTIHAKAPNGLYARLLDQTCESYIEMNNYKRATKYCADSLALNPTSLFGLLSRAKSQLEADDFQAAIDTLNQAKEHHGNQQRIQQMQQEASTLLKRSKQKDYYKVLGVSRDADEREIKRAYRKLTMQYHPDKAAVHGISKEEAEKKMASINEAYEVLEDPELKARFDRGDDPNDQESQRQHPFQGSPFGGGQQFFFQQGGGGGGFPGGSFQFQGGGGFPGGFPFG